MESGGHDLGREKKINGDKFLDFGFIKGTIR